jgi:Ca-activated chloride channel family protein
VIPLLDLDHIVFDRPAYLWFLIVPIVLALLWIRQFSKRRADVKRLAGQRTVPVAERFALAGDLPFWMSLIAATACLVIALARPQGPSNTPRRGGIDLVILQDGSASMRVKDVVGDRWRRSMQFLRRLGDSLGWQQDRIAMALFARIAAPQIRLTTDPNTFFFFLDHLDERPPFRIEDDTTWDTNLELGIYWGLRLIEKDEELHGRSANARVFVMLSDGEAWSGEVAKSVALANERGIPLFVVGVGTLAGGRLPVVDAADGAAVPARLVSRLDRESLQRLAASGGGRYFELDRQSDRDIANTIIDAGRRLAPPIGVDAGSEELYWTFLAGAAALAGLGLLFVRERTELWLQMGATALTLVAMWGVLG